MNSSTRRAFTLPDLVAATGCVAALGFIASTALSAGSRASLTAQDQANLLAIGQAAAQWSIDHSGALVGSPESARELFNDPSAQGLNVDTDGLATQPFDWASPLAWGYLSDLPAPERRDERFAYATGVQPVFYDAAMKTPPVAIDAPVGALSVLSDPAQDVLSVPYYDGPLPAGLVDTYFTVQTATSYIAAREFLWWGQGNSGLPRWLNQDEGTWAGSGTFFKSATHAGWLPGKNSTSSNGSDGDALARAYRPFLDRIGPPSRKIFLANGTRYQSPDISSADHDIRADASFGGAFADIGAWASDPRSPHASDTWANGTLNNGQDIVRNSFRHGDEHVARGNTLRYDGSVVLMDIDDARDPSLWFPSGSSIGLQQLPESTRNNLSPYVEPLPGLHPFIQRAIIW